MQSEPCVYSHDTHYSHIDQAEPGKCICPLRWIINELNIEISWVGREVAVILPMSIEQWQLQLCLWETVWARWLPRGILIRLGVVYDCLGVALLLIVLQWTMILLGCMSLKKVMVVKRWYFLMVESTEHWAQTHLCMFVYGMPTVASMFICG